MGENHITNPDHPDHPLHGRDNERKTRERRERKAFEKRIADSMERHAHILDRLANGSQADPS